MAKKKNFENLVDETFQEGYTSEPETSVEPNLERPVEEAPPAEKEAVSENEVMLRKILAGDKEVLSNILHHEGRYTFYLSDVLRACVDIMAYEEDRTKTEIIADALSQFFSERVKAAAKDRVVSLAIKDLERKVKEENQ